jgi:hypothetical protein
VLDVAIVNVALPSIKTDLHFSQKSLQWVITAYSIIFGGVFCSALTRSAAVELGAPPQPATLPWREAYEFGDRYPSGSLTGDGDHRRLPAPAPRS